MFRLNALTGFKPLGPKVALDLVYSILKDYTRLASNDKTIVFCWIARLGNIRGSDTADAAAVCAHVADYKDEISSKRTDTLCRQVLFG